MEEFPLICRLLRKWGSATAQKFNRTVMIAVGRFSYSDLHQRQPSSPGETPMANFQRAPLTLLRTPRRLPASLTQDMKDRMLMRGTYDMFKDSEWVLKVPFGNTTWKQPQSRLIAVWGGDDQGNRLVVTARNPIVEVLPVTDQPILPHTWVYIVRALTTDVGSM